MRSGFSLVELLSALCVLAVVLGFAFPRFTAIADGAAVREEAARVAGAIDMARGVAVRFQQTATLALSDSSYSVQTLTGVDTLMAWQSHGAAWNGVLLSGAGAGITFGASGIATGVANRTLVMRRGAAIRRVVISRLGRVTY